MRIDISQTKTMRSEQSMIPTIAMLTLDVVMVVDAFGLPDVVTCCWVALRTAPTPKLALRGQIPMVALMILYTVASLWILSQPVVE